MAWKTQWLAAHPEEAAAFDADAYFENEYLSDWWYSSKEEFMSDWGLETEQDFCDFMRDDWLAGMQADEARQSWMDQYESAHPGASAPLTPTPGSRHTTMRTRSRHSWRSGDWRPRTPSGTSC